jgi:hypothetical protein
MSLGACTTALCSGYWVRRATTSFALSSLDQPLTDRTSGIFGDIIRQSRALHQVFKAEAKLKQDKQKEIDPTDSEVLMDITHGQALTMSTIQEVKHENMIGIMKSLCDSVRKHR